MNYTVATLPKGYAIAFATDDLEEVIKANGYTQLMDISHLNDWEEAINEVNRRNEEIEQKRNSSLVIVSQGLHSIANVNGDMNHILAALTKFICDTLSKGGFTFSQIDRMIDFVMQHMDNLAELQSKTFDDLKDVVDQVEFDEECMNFMGDYYDDDYDD